MTFQRIFLFFILVFAVLLLRQLLRSNVPALLPDKRPFTGDQWRRNYDEVEPFYPVSRLKDSLAKVRKGALYGYVNTKGREVIPVQYPFLGYFHQYAKDALMQKNGYWGQVDVYGNETMEEKTVKDAPLHFMYQYFAPYDELIWWENMAAVKSVASSDWGFIDRQGREQVYCQYDKAHLFQNGMAVVGKRVGEEMRYGYVNAKGKAITPIVYAYAANFYNGYAHVRLDTASRELYFVIDKQGKIISKGYEDIIGDFFNGVALVQNKAGQYTYIDTTGKELFEPLYDRAYPMYNDFTAVQINNKQGVINKKGTLIIPCIYEKTNYFGENIIGVRQQYKWGFVDSKGTVRVPIQYDSVGVFRYGYAPVAQQGNWGMVDKKGNMVVPTKYKQLVRWGKNYVLFTEDRQTWGALRLSDQKIIWEPIYKVDFGTDPAPYIPPHPVKVSEYGLQWGYMDTLGQAIIPLQYKNLGTYSPIGTAVCDVGSSKWYWVQNGGEKMTDKYQRFTYDYISSIVEGYAFMNYSILIKADNMLQISNFYLSGYKDFSQGLAAIKTDKGWGFINTKAEAVIPLLYDNARSFHEGMAAVYLGKSEWCYFDAKGAKQWDLNFAQAWDFADGTAPIVDKDGIHALLLNNK